MVLFLPHCQILKFFSSSTYLVFSKILKEFLYLKLVFSVHHCGGVLSDNVIDLVILTVLVYMHEFGIKGR
jgi:hypothetical protein